MKAKNVRKRAADKKAYVGPSVTILRPDSEEAKKLADAVASGSTVKCQEVVASLKTKSSKERKRKLPRTA